MGKKAFLIGAKTDGLLYTQNDVDKMRTILSKHSYKVLVSSPGKISLISDFDEFIEDLNQTDTVIFYYSGHAYSPKGELNLIIDSTSSNSKNELSLKYFLDLIDKCKGRDKLVILDCCQAGVALLNWKPEPTESYHMLTASNQFEKAKELDELESSFLTYYLHKALSDNILDIVEGNKVSIDDLYEWLKRKAEEHNGTHNSIKVPIPNLIGNRKGNLIIAEIAPSIVDNTTGNLWIASKERIIWIYPFSLPKKFVGRANYTTQITYIISTRRDPSGFKSTVVCLTGIGGIGKSCLVRKVIEDIRYTSLPYKYIVWFSFANAKAENSTYIYRSILQKIDDNFSQFIRDKEELQKKEQDGEVLIINDKLLRERLCDIIDKNPILLIIDNLETIQNTIQDDKVKQYGCLRTEFNQLSIFFKHVMNNSNSIIITTSRLNINEYNNNDGYKEIKLDVFEKEEGADLLESLGVKGNNQDLMNLSETLRNHALCLVAAGKYMAMKNLSPDKFKNTYLSKAFESSEEGTKMLEILNLYRELLTREQEYFLKMASIHLRSVTKKNFPELVRNYIESEEDTEYIEERIIQPLVIYGLIYKTIDSENQTTYSIHPLMKFAYVSWFNTPLTEAYEILAKVVKLDAHLIKFQNNINDLQPYFDSVYYYIKAERFTEAYNIICKCYNSIIEFQAFDTTNNYLIQLEKAYRQLKFKPDDEIDFLDKLSFTSKDDEIRIKYRKEAFEKLKRLPHLGDIHQLAGLLCDLYIEYGYLDEAKDLIDKYLSNDSILFYLKGNLSYIKGKYKHANGFLENYYTRQYGHNKCRTAQRLCSPLIAAKNYTRAKEVAKESLEKAIESGFNCCALPLFDYLIEIEIEQENITAAIEFQKEAIKYSNMRGMDYEENQILKLCLGKYEEVVEICRKNISTSEEKKFNRVKEIYSLILMAKASKEKNDITEANHYSITAKQLMDEYKIYRDNSLIEKWEL